MREESQSLGARLRQIRVEAGLSARQVADVVGCDHNTVCRIETGFISSPRRDTWQGVLRALLKLGVSRRKVRELERL